MKMISLLNLKIHLPALELYTYTFTGLFERRKNAY
jgi:hypothetical protein